MNEAEKFIDENDRFFTNDPIDHNYFECKEGEILVSKLIKLLRKNCSIEKSIFGYECGDFDECYVFDDGSYITRCDEFYTTGNDIVDFRITNQMKLHDQMFDELNKDELMLKKRELQAQLRVIDFKLDEM
jgi:hypothetical protein